MDRQTDGQNYDSQDRANIAVSRSKNISFTQARFSDLLQHLAWKWSRPILVSVVFTNLSLTYLDTYPLTYSPGPTRASDEKVLR